jgi:hypothetical protein
VLLAWGALHMTMMSCTVLYNRPGRATNSVGKVGWGGGQLDDSFCVSMWRESVLMEECARD